MLTLAAVLVGPPVAKALLLAFALASADFALGACWAVCLDVGATHAGVVTGFMNTFGNVGGLVGPLVVGYMVERWGSWTYPFYITAARLRDGRRRVAGRQPAPTNSVMFARLGSGLIVNRETQA